MIRSTSPPRLGSEFDTFLFASIEDDKNGMLLSVLSAFARLDVDPWEEAANLVRLPGEKAIERLTSLITALPDGPAAHRNPGTAAARLIALLPRGTGANISRHSGVRVSEPTNTEAIRRAIFTYVILAGFLLGAQWFAVSRQMLTQAADVPLTNPNTASAQPVAPDSVQRRPAGPLGRERP